MEEFKKTIQYHPNALNNSLSALPYSKNEICFFDIETTGLSPRISSVYLIGAVYFDGENFQLVQWFADDYVSEKNLLESFSAFLQSFSVLIHYNGTTFDIPYLEKKYMQHQLKSPFPELESLDLFTDIRRQKNWFDTPDKKLATMEKLLGFERNDRYTGKDCIAIYTDFMQKKVFHDRSADDCKKNLLLHNHDDLIGTILCSQFLLYTRCSTVHQPIIKIAEDSFAIQDTIHGSFPLPFQRQLLSKNNDYIGMISFSGQTICMEIPLFHGTLRHFFKDYKNYYYLPVEDMAVHKSVGIYVDSSRREKATASNCYTKKTGTFLLLPDKAALSSMPHFQEEKKSPVHYLLLDENKPLSKEQIQELFYDLQSSLFH